MRTIFHWLKKPKNTHKEELMQHFSQEHLERLVNEHKLVSITITQLTQHGTYTQKARLHGIDALTVAITNLKARKIELEGMIDVLNDFLNS